MSADAGKTRVLSMAEVRSVLSVEDSIELQRSAFLALGRGRTVAAPNAWLRLPGEQRGWLKLLAGYDQDSDGLGVKVLARFPRNPPGKNLGSLLLLFHPEHGSPLAIMDAVYITAVRTAAGAALATQALARDGARSLGMVGTGVLAWYSVLAHRHLFSELGSIKVYSRSAERREAFADRVREQVGIEAVAVDSVGAATSDVDVIVSATNAPEPVLGAEHVSPGQHLNAIGIRTELTPELVARCRVIGDGREETLLDGKFSVALAAGAVREDELGPDLGTLLDGGEVGRRSADEITMFDSSGVAIQDILCAVHVHERACENGIGTLTELGSGAVLD